MTSPAPWDQDAFKRALDFAARAHGEQRVPGSGFPYVVHVTKVATEALAACLAEGDCDTRFAIECALLHDVVEDAGVSRAELEASFGPRVASGVSALTKDASLPKAERMADCLRRIQAAPREVALVKLADRITNLEPPPANWDADKRRRYLAEAEVIVTALAPASPFLASRIRAKMAEYAHYVDA
jgi:(p)ppGpp synthase/HD superfamily hydrolase